MSFMFDLQRIKESIMHQINVSLFKPCRVANLVILIGSVSCFLPNMMGFKERTVEKSLDNDDFQSISNQGFNNSQYVSIAVTLIILFENLFDSAITYKYFRKDDAAKASQETEMTYFKFPTEIILVILVKDFVTLFLIIPNFQYGILAGLTACTDTLFTWCYFYNLHRLGG